MKTFQQFPIFTVSVRDPAGPLDLITFVSPDEMDGLPGEAIVGKLLGPSKELVPENFARNRAFVDFMHRVIQESVPQIQELAEVARRAASGWFQVLDMRAFKTDPQFAAKDIIGEFPIERGAIVAEKYVPNPDHWILSEHGMVTPHPEIQDRILAAMRTLKRKPEPAE